MTNPTSLCEELYHRLLSIWGPATHGRNMYAAFRGAGALDAVALEAALNDVVGRQDALRASFMVADGKLVKTVHPNRAITIETRQLGDVDDAALADACAARIAHDFDLAHEPLITAAVLRRTDDFALVVVVHHLVFDAGSFAILFTELAKRYAARSPASVSASGLAPLETTPDDFAVWQRSLVAEGGRETREALAAHWAKSIARMTPLESELVARAVPAPAPDVEPGLRRMLPFRFSASEDAALRATAARHRISLVVLTCAAFATLLREHTGRDDVVFMYLHNLRAQFALRNRARRASLDGTMGYFANGIPFALDFRGAEDDATILMRARAEMIDATSNSDLPLPVLDPGHGERLRGLFAAGFNFQRQRTAFDLPHVELERLPLDALESGRWKFHMLLECRIVESSATAGYMIFDASRLDEAAVAHLIDRYRAILDRMCAPTRENP